MAASVIYLSKATVTAGVRVPLSLTSVVVASVIVQAKPANAGLIYVGDSTVSATAGLALGIPNANATPDSFTLYSGSDLNLLNLQDIYIDSSVSGEGVNVLYYVR